MVRKESLENGWVLSELLKMCKAENTKEHTCGLLRCLRDSKVWVPMNMRVSAADTSRLLSSKVGDAVVISEEIGIKPDILMDVNTNTKILPVFSQKEQIPDEYKSRFSWLHIDFIAVCDWICQYADVHSIVIDPLTMSYIFPKKHTTTIKAIESALVVPHDRDLNKFKGCLAGGAIGDALGYPVEFMELDQMQEKYGGQGIARYELKDGKALISDDTQMTLFTANGLLYGFTRFMQTGSMKKSEYYIWKAYKDWYTAMLKAQAKTWRSWLHEVPGMVAVRGPGHTCISALRGWDMGRIDKPLNNSKGNGGVMRVAPIGLYFTDQSKLEETCMLGAKVAAVTHGHPLGYITSAAMVYIINQLACSNCDIELAVTESITISEKLFPHKQEELETLRNLLKKALILSRYNIADIIAIEQLGKGAVAEEALAIAVYCSCKYQDDFAKAMIAAVNHSGDSDSTGSIAGSILGVYLGYDALPEFFKTDLECLDVILEIAEDLYNAPTVLEKPFAEVSGKWKRKYIDCRRYCGE